MTTAPVAFAARPPARWLVAALVCALFGAGICTLSWFNRKRHADMPSLISGQPGFSVLYLADPAGKLGFDEILSRAAAGGFSGERPAPGSNECVWYRLSVANDSGADLLSVLAPSNEFLLDVRLYRVAADGSREFQLAGNSVRWSDRTFPVLRPAFEVTLPARTRSVLYLRIFDPVKQPNHFLLWLDARVFRRLNNLYGLQLTGYFSLWTVMMAYNGFLYAVLRRRDYLFYFLYILSIGALIYSASDLSTAVVSWPHWPLRGIVVTILLNVTVFFLVQFSRLFLETRERAPRLDRLIRPLGWILLALCFACPAWLTATSARWYLAADVSAVLGVTAALPLLGLLLLRRRLPQAGLYVLAFVPLAAGVIYSLRESVGIPEARSNGIPALVGDALQLVFLALALAARYKRISDDASRMSLEYTARLESEVAERTLELRSSNESLARASRDKDRVLGIIGHDLRGPAHQLYSLSQVLSAGPGSQSPEDLVHLASEIEETCKAEIDLLDNLLLWSRMQSDGVVQIKAEVQPADEIVKASAASMERTARAKNIVIAVELEPGLGFKADTQVVQTVIRNLLGNAIKFTGTGGRVSVAVRSRGGRVEIAVTDTGTGMSETQLKELFKGPVSSTEGTRSEKGAGIGLVLCHDLALANGGELRIESQLGSGTTATLILPGADAALQTPLSQRPCSS